MPKYTVDDLVVSVDDLVPPDLNEQASQAAGIPLKGIQPPKVKMEQTPGATGLNVVNEAIVRPARSIQKGYYEGAAGGAHLLSNLAKGAGKLTGTTPGGAFESAEGFYRGEADKLEGQGATGLAKPLYEAIGRTPADLAKYTVATTALGGPLGMAAVDAATEADKGFGHAALAGAKGAALGSLGHVMAPARTGTRMLGMGTAMGAETAIGGGSPTDTAAAFLTGAGMAAPGANGTSFKVARLGEQRANIELEALRREHAAQAARPGDYFGTRETAPNEQSVEIKPPTVESPVLKTEQQQPVPFKPAKAFTVDDLEVPNDREGGQQVQAGVRQGQEPGNVPVAGRSAAPGEAGPVLQEQAAVPEGPPRQEIPAAGREGLQPVGISGSNRIHVDDLMPAPKSEPPREEVIQPKAAPAGAEQAAPAQQRIVADPREMRIPIEDLHVDPQRFQYKMDAFLKGGVTDEYKGVKVYDRDQAGTIAVWRDPADGKTYVVNGHHRYEMAARLGEDSMAVRYVDAPDAAQARLKGALINIGDGKGTAVDAAKVFRDSGLTPEELTASGISLKGRVAEDGLALSKLTGVLFDDVVRGGLTHRQGAIIGKGNLSEAAQVAVAKFMAGHPNMREGALEEVVRRAGKAGSKQVEQESLFGTNAYEESLFNEEAHLVADIKARLGQEKRLFSVVGNENAASRLAGAGNKIEAERNAQIAGEAGEALGVFDALQDKSGPIADAIAQAAQEVANGKPRKQVADQLYGVVRAEVSKAVRGREGGLFEESGGGTPGGAAEGPGLFDAPAGVSPRRLSEQGGFLTIPGKQPTAPLDAAEQARADWAAKREAARKGKEYSFLEKLTKRKSEFVDNLSPILDVLAKNNDESRRDFSNAADRSLGSRELSEREIRDGGLMRAIQAADDYQKLNDFLVAKEAIRESQGKGRETGVDLAGARAIYNKYLNMPANESGITYGQLAKEVGMAGDRLLDYSVKSGLVSQQLAEAWRRQYGAEHVPLARIMGAIEDASTSMSGTKATASLSSQTVYGKRVGSERAIENPLETMLERTRKAYEQGEKNKAAALLASYASKPEMKGLLQEVKEADSKTSFTYLRDGQKVVVQTTPQIAAAAKCLNAQQMNKTLALIMNGPARLARMGTTGANIAFGFANPVGDWFTTLVNSKEYRDTSLNPAVFGQAFAAAYLHNKTWSRIEKTGAGFTSLDLFRETMPQTVGGMRQFRGGKDYAKHLVDAEGFKGNKVKWAVGIPVKRAAGLVRAIEDFNNRGEQFGRARLFLGTERANLRRGASAAEAEAAGVYSANNELPNYRRHGDVTNGLGGAILYLNARVQGARSFVSAFQDRPVQTATKIMVGVYAPMAMLTVANMIDDERRKIYNDIPEYEKEGYMIYIAPGATKNEKTGRYDGVFKMKMAPDIGAIATPVRRAIESQMGGAKVNPLQDVARPVAGSILPFDPTPRGAAAGLLPQTVKPTIEYLSNYDTFRQKPIVNQRLQDLPTEEQVAPNTSGTMKKVAGALNAPPVKVEQFVKSTLGGWTPQLLNLADTAAAAVGGIKPDEIGGETLPSAVAKRFTSAAGGAQENSYYTLRREAQEKAARYYIGLVKANPAFEAFDDQQKKKAINSAANQARQTIIKAEGGKSIRTADPERKVEIMKEFIERLPE